MGFIKEFKEFAMKGNVMDLAVGVIIGAAFAKIVDSLVNDLVMPLVSAIFGQPDFSNMYVVLKGVVPTGAALADARKVAGSVIFAYGNFVNVLISFILLMIIIFTIIKMVNSMKRKNENTVVEVAEPSTTEKLLAQIRDSLKK